MLDLLPNKSDELPKLIASHSCSLRQSATRYVLFMVTVHACMLHAASNRDKISPARIDSDLDYLHRIAHEVVDSAMVEAGAEIAGTGRNTTGYALRVPGGTRNYYPAFWIRDAAMMLGADLVPQKEVEGWIRVVAATQPGPKGLSFDHGLRIPAYCIPDHITLKGEACWYPGAYVDQGVGSYGILPPADDAYYFIQMVYEQYRLSHDTTFYRSSVKTGWGEQHLYDVCEKAFDSVASDPATGLVQCDKTEWRVDWGFCDSVRKSGLCLMPSLLRWQAAVRLAELSEESHRPSKFRAIAKTIQKSIVKTFYQPTKSGEAMMISATDLGRQDDIWASAFAVFLNVLPKKESLAVSRHLLALYTSGAIVQEGQVRHLPRGEYWERSSSGKDEYQNGGYWATPTGWLIVALSKVDRKAAEKLLSEYIAHIRTHREQGAPFEWINPDTKRQVNANYASSAGLVYIALKLAGWKETPSKHQSKEAYHGEIRHVGQLDRSGS